MSLQNGFTIPDNLARTSLTGLVGENYMVSPAFDIDGRDHDEFGHVFDWDSLTDPIWIEGPYVIRGCIDFEPCCVLLAYDDDPVGFYMGGQAWVDPEHRGNGFGAKMIVSSISMSKELPDVKNIGFSEAGFAAHESALALLRSYSVAPLQTPG